MRIAPTIDMESTFPLVRSAASVCRSKSRWRGKVAMVIQACEMIQLLSQRTKLFICLALLSDRTFAIKPLPSCTPFIAQPHHITTQIASWGRRIKLAATVIRASAARTTATYSRVPRVTIARDDTDLVFVFFIMLVMIAIILCMIQI